MGAMITLNNHPVWQNLSEVINGLDANALVLEHLALCDYQISGYWDESDRFYENIILPRPLSPQLISRVVGWVKRQRNPTNPAKMLGYISFHPTYKIQT